MGDIYRILNGAKYFSSGLLQKYLVLISANKCTKFFSGTQWIYSRKYREVSEEGIKKPPGLDYYFCSKFD